MSKLGPARQPLAASGRPLSKRKFGITGVQWGTNKIHAYNNPAFESFIEGTLGDGLMYGQHVRVKPDQQAINMGPDNRTLAEVSEMYTRALLHMHLPPTQLEQHHCS